MTCDGLIVNVQVAGNYTYVGKATRGSATSAAVWQIFRVDKTTGTIILWASGTDNFDKVFDDRASYSYS